MKILFLTDNFPPELNAPATRTYEHCKAWVNAGVDVTVITCFPNFPKGEIFPGYKNKLYQKEEIDGIKVIRVWSLIFENKGIFKRFLDFISFSVTGFIAGLFVRKIDKIIITSPQFFVTFSGFFLSLFKRKPWVFEVRDLWPESIIVLNNYNKNFMFRVFEKCEMFFYKNSSQIIAVTKGIRDNIIERGIDADKIILIRNGFSFENLPEDIQDKSALKKSIGLEDNEKLISYIGTHGQAHALDFIIKTIAKVNDLNIRFLFIGNGAEKDNLIQLSSDLGISRITFLDSVPKESVFEFIKLSDWALVNLKNDPLFEGAIPSKIFENAALRTPILLGVNGEAKELINKYQAGITFEPERESDFIRVLQLIHNDELNYSELQNGAFKLAKEFDRGKLALKLLHSLNGDLKITSLA
ncbi:glycosyltransferase family 4 protein [Litoribacter ruber]|uniref:glycosyltransferase family 4 protein n=1 Tax=Litoribacter ruber TaxID=702568 RepID=UPI001BD98E3F|nr:glycosyltransferase family 4 protein [Litoribacter ruber]MBT0812853.1 glycosyltransferase family 4 protein [Litoribacter ruber]